MAVTLSGVCQEIIDRLADLSSPSKEDLDRIKMEVSKQYTLPGLPKNSDILQNASFEGAAEKVRGLLRRKLVRSISGVNVVSVMTRPWGCPHGKCSYCPGGPDVNLPQSYTSEEPATLRGRQNNYDPFKQVAARIQQLRDIGHDVDKIELIILGGTFTAAPKIYQESFVKGCLDGILGEETASLEVTKRLAETRSPKNVGMTVETRPDWAREEEINRMLSFGVTKVELGVQTIYDDIYLRINRCHSVADVVNATQRLKDSGLKLCYHMMLGLPGSTPERDLEAFRTLFSNPDFRPDMMKIYPCLVVKGTEIYNWWSQGEYIPYTTEEAAQIIVEVKKMIPPWVRIMRIQREISAHQIVAGVRKSDLRELVLATLDSQGVRCRCIRCREIGHRLLRGTYTQGESDLKMKRMKYFASGGEEHFVSVEAEDETLVGYLRLRMPSQNAFRNEVNLAKTAIIRELHVYGPLVPVGQHNRGAWQHRGYGSLLLGEAEKISREEYEASKLLVISALGTKPYYARHGFSHDGPYMSKRIE